MRHINLAPQHRATDPYQYLLAQASNPDELGEQTRKSAMDALVPVFGQPTSTVSNGSDFIEESAERENLVESLNLKNQYVRLLDHFFNLRSFGRFVQGTPIPSYDQVLKTFSTEQLRFAKDYLGPTLILVPETSFFAKVDALNKAMTYFRARASEILRDEGTTRAQRETAEWISQWRMVDADEDFFYNSDSGSATIEGWEAFIIDGSNTLYPKEIHDDWSLTLRERIKNRKAYRRPGEGGMDRHRYVMFVLMGLMEGAPPDYRKNVSLRSTWLDDDPTNSKTQVANAGWLPGQKRVFFFCQSPDYPYEGFRFRRSVGGRVPGI